MRLKNALGNFDFPDEIELSMAKAVRDAVSGQWFNPKQNELRLYNEDDCYEYIGCFSSDRINGVHFTLELLVPKPPKKVKRVKKDAITAVTAFEEVKELTDV